MLQKEDTPLLVLVKMLIGMLGGCGSCKQGGERGAAFSEEQLVVVVIVIATYGSDLV